MEKILIKSIAIVFFVVLYVKRRSIYYWNYVFNGHLLHDLKPVLKITNALRSDLDSVKNKRDEYGRLSGIDNCPQFAPAKPPRHYPLETGSFKSDHVFCDEKPDGSITFYLGEKESKHPIKKKRKHDPIETRISENGTIEYYCKECTIWSPNYDWIQSDHEKTTRYKCYCGKSYYVKHD